AATAGRATWKGMVVPPWGRLTVQRVGALRMRLRPERMLAQGVEVRLDAESRPFGKQEAAVLEADRHRRCAVAQRTLRLHLLEDVEVGNRGGEVHRGGRADRP